jgi:hypothetical protein
MGQLRAHVDRVREEVARLASKSGGGGAAAAAAAAASADPKDVCTVCRQSKFTFEPPCLYCTQCGQRIKRGQTFHSTPPVRGRRGAAGLWGSAAAGAETGRRVLFLRLLARAGRDAGCWARGRA